MAMEVSSMAGMDPSQIPSGMPPPGVTPNFVNPPSQAHFTTIVTSVTLPLMILFVALRMYADIGINRKFEKAGWASLVAMAAAICYCAMIYRTLSHHTLGKHIWDVPIILNTNASVQDYSILNILYGPAAFLSKLSVLMLYLRIFGVRKITKLMTYLAIGINFVQCIIAIVGYAALCVPAPGHSWQLSAARNSCVVTANSLSVALAAISVFNDFYIIILPLPAIWELQMSTKRKAGVSAIFFTGLLVCVASILNLVYRERQRQNVYHDNTWNGAISYMLTVVEINVAIMCSCMPSYTVFVRRHQSFFRSLRSRLRSDTWSFRRLRSSRKHSDADSDLEKMAAKRTPSDDSHETKENYDHALTLGSAIKKDGQFLETVDRDRAVRSQQVDSGYFGGQGVVEGGLGDEEMGSPRDRYERTGKLR